MLIVTSHGVPGHRVEAVLGTVVGTALRRTDVGVPRGPGSGERDELVRAARAARLEALDEAWHGCVARGANAVVGLRFDTAQIGALTEVCAYGTAVLVAPIPGGEPGATPQSTAIAARGQQPTAPSPGLPPQTPVSPSQTPVSPSQPAGSALQPAPPSVASPRTGPDVAPDDPRWLPTADGPTTDVPHGRGD